MAISFCLTGPACKRCENDEITVDAKGHEIIVNESEKIYDLYETNEE